MAKEQTLNLKFKVTDEGTIILEKVSKSIKTVEENTKSMASSLNLIKVQALVTLGQQAIATARQVENFLMIGARAKAVEESFNTIAAASGIMSEKLIKDMKAASGVFVEETEVMVKAQRLLLEGFKSDELVKLTEVARLTARVMGITVADAFDRVSEAVISLRTRGLRPAFPDLKDADEITEKYANSLGSTSKNLTVAGERQAVFNEIMRAYNERLKEIGPLQENQSEQLQKLGSGWEAVIEVASMGFLKFGDILARFGDKTGTAIKTWAENVEEASEKTYEGLDTASEAVGEFSLLWDLMNKKAQDKSISKAIFEINEGIASLSKSMDLLKDKPILPTGAFRSWVKEFDGLTYAINQLHVTTEDVLVRNARQTIGYINTIAAGFSRGEVSIRTYTNTLKAATEELKRLVGEDTHKLMMDRAEIEAEYDRQVKKLQERYPERGKEYQEELNKLIQIYFEQIKKLDAQGPPGAKQLQESVSNYEKAKNKFQEMYGIIEDTAQASQKIGITIDPTMPLEQIQKIADRIKELRKEADQPIEIQIVSKYSSSGGGGGGGEPSSLGEWKDAVMGKGEGGEGGGEAEFNVSFFGTGSTKLPLTDKISEIISMFGSLENASKSLEANINLIGASAELARAEAKLKNLEAVVPGITRMVQWTGSQWWVNPGTPLWAQQYASTIIDLKTVIEQWRSQMAIYQMQMHYGGSMQEGGYVPRTGLYRLHEGEKVIPRSISSTMTNNFYITGSNPREVAEAVKKALKYNLTDLNKTIKEL